MKTLQLFLLSFVLLIAGCDKNESTPVSITDFDPEQLNQTIYADQTATSNGGFAFPPNPLQKLPIPPPHG